MAKTKTTAEKPIIDFKISTTKDAKAAEIVGGEFAETGQAVTCYVPKVLLKRGRVLINLDGTSNNVTGRVRVYKRD